jgi:hypothetical protein
MIELILVVFFLVLLAGNTTITIETVDVEEEVDVYPLILIRRWGVLGDSLCRL